MTDEKNAPTAPGGDVPLPPGVPGMGAFDFSSIQSVLNDPSIMQMAQQIAQDPSFQEMTQKLQESMQGLLGGAAGAAGAEGGDDAAAPPDPSKYFEAMNGMLTNPQFMQMAEKLGQEIMQDPSVSNMMQGMQDPNFKANMGAKMEALKEDPELGPIIKDIEENGPPAMMKYWNNPEVLAKLGGAMQNSLGDVQEDGEEEDDANEYPVHAAASEGDAAKLRQLLTEDKDSKNAKDSEGRSALHFAAGYGELECVKVLLEFEADVDALDDNKNTALHYAAGYGQAECVQLLLDGKANVELKNLDGKTAVEVAELNSQDAVCKVLKGKQ